VPQRGFSPLLALAVLLVTGSGAKAQTSPAPAPPRITLSVTAATIGYGDLQTQPVLAVRTGEDAEGTEVTEQAVLGRTVRMEGGLQVTGSIAVALDPWWSVRAGLGVGWARLGQGFSGADAWVVDAAAVPVAGSDQVTVSTVEAAIRFRLPSAHTLRPYLEMGAVAERWQSRATAQGAFPGADALADAVTRVGGHAAVGGHYPLTNRLAVRGQASARVLQTPLPPATPGREVGSSDGLVLTFREPAGAASAPFADPSRQLVQGLRLELGLSYSPGGVVAPPPDRSGSDDSSDAPPR
jgi:hypothetical protein